MHPIACANARSRDWATDHQGDLKPSRLAHPPSSSIKRAISNHNAQTQGGFARRRCANGNIRDQTRKVPDGAAALHHSQHVRDPLAGSQALWWAWYLLQQQKKLPSAR